MGHTRCHWGHRGDTGDGEMLRAWEGHRGHGGDTGRDMGGDVRGGHEWKHPPAPALPFKAAAGTDASQSREQQHRTRAGHRERHRDQERDTGNDTRINTGTPGLTLRLGYWD